MALAFCNVIAKIGSNGIPSRLCKSSSPMLKNGSAMQVAFITGKANRVNRPKRPPPFPYWEKTYNFWQRVIDPMQTRFDDNTKIVVVEGPVAAGKDKFARKLAEELEMYYMEPFTFDMIYLNEYGFDRRKLDHLLPESCQSCDIPRFLSNPHLLNVTAFQFQQFHLKLLQYSLALLHILSTGQGVVLNRCVYSDFVFMDTMHKSGFVTRKAYDMYKEIVGIAKEYILRPHLLIYLDIPVDEVKKRIKKRNIPYEVNSKALTTKYLTDMETTYKEEYLKNLTEHSHVLIYDWTKEGDIPAVVGDIEDLEFDNYDIYDKKMADWVFENRHELYNKRVLYQMNFTSVLRELQVPWHDVDEMWIPPEDVAKFQEVLSLIPSEEYAAGFNPNMRDKILWKSSHSYNPFRPKPDLSRVIL